MTVKRPTVRLTAVAAIVAGVAVAFSACDLGPTESRSAEPSQPAASPAGRASPTGASASGTGGDINGLIAAAKADGGLTTIALPHTWCNYGEVLSSFSAKYGIPITELNPAASYGDELQAIRANRDGGPQAPDVIDVGFAFGAQAKADGLIQPYRVSTWTDIPDDAKDTDGYWYGDYYGVLAFETNTAVVRDPPLDWADLLSPARKDQVALAGDPRVSTQAIQTVYAAALASGGSLDDAQPGLDFFETLNDRGNLLATIADRTTIDQGATPITVRWTYSALQHKKDANGDPQIDVTVPPSGRLAGVSVQAISAYAPHPNAAKLWMEHLYSDEGQLLWLEGLCHPIRYEAMAKAAVIPAELLATLPDTTGAVFPAIDQLTEATELIAKRWDAAVGLDIR